MPLSWQFGLWLLVLVVVVSGCSGAGDAESSQESTTSEAFQASTAPQATQVAAMPPPAVASETADDPAALSILGPDVWLISDWQRPDVVVRTGVGGTVEEQLWEQDPDVVGSLESGHTIICDDVDLDGQIDVVDLRFELDGLLKDVYRESKSVNGQVISEISRPVDGTSLPPEVHEICGLVPGGPILRLTALQWTAALDSAGFVDVAGDHAIDPVWAAEARWEGVSFGPLTLYQGDFRPEQNGERELLECTLGAIGFPTSLPEDARSALVAVSGC